MRGDSPCRAMPGLGEQPSPHLTPARAAPAALGQRRKEHCPLGGGLLHVAKEREGAMKEKSVKHPSLLHRSGQGAPGLFPPPFCQGLLSGETFQPALPCFPPGCPRQGRACRSLLPSRLPSPQQTHRCNVRAALGWGSLCPPDPWGVPGWLVPKTFRKAGLCAAPSTVRPWLRIEPPAC